MTNVTQTRQFLLQSSRIVTFSGAGLSAESGISTFRDAETGGIWGKYDPMQLASPEGFASDPELIIRWYNERRRSVAAATPNEAHLALVARLNLIHITQNVDNLLERAGAHDVIHLHGTLTQDRCHGRCGYIEEIDLSDPPGLRQCPQCEGSMRPNVVWFGEVLPEDVIHAAQRACMQCDALLVIGTSAVVYPAASLIDVAHEAGAKIIIVNTRRSDASHLADVELSGKAGEIVPQLLV